MEVTENSEQDDALLGNDRQGREVRKGVELDEKTVTLGGTARKMAVLADSRMTQL